MEILGLHCAEQFGCGPGLWYHVLISGYQRFGITCCLYLQGRTIYTLEIEAENSLGTICRITGYHSLEVHNPVLSRVLHENGGNGGGTQSGYLVLGWDSNQATRKNETWYHCANLPDRMLPLSGHGVRLRNQTKRNVMYSCLVGTELRLGILGPNVITPSRGGGADVLMTQMHAEICSRCVNSLFFR
jgi:hypothetical protein